MIKIRVAFARGRNVLNFIVNASKPVRCVKNGVSVTSAAIMSLKMSKDCKLLVKSKKRLKMAHSKKNE